MATQKVEEEYPAIEAAERLNRTYKNPVLFLRKSAAGEHLYAFNVEKRDAEGMVLGNDVGSLLLNISEVSKLLDGTMEWIKVSVLPPREG